jgi:flagella basal body P-ring formation protein FlgA
MDLHSIRSNTILILFIIIFLWVGLLPPASALEIRVKEAATVMDDKVLLGDIASFEPNNDSRVNQLRNIEIASAPSPGVDYGINESLLIYKIGPYINHEDDIHIHVPQTLHVRRNAQVIGSAQLEKIFKDFISDHSPWPMERLRFESINTPETVMLPEGRLHWEVREKQYRDLIGNVSLNLSLYVDGKHVRTVPLSGRISVLQDVVKAAVRINEGHVISDGDLILITENNVRLRKSAITNISDAIGKRSVRSIRAGQIILSKMIEIPPMVKKGNRVLIKAENEEIRITASGKVLEDGRSGEQVKVMNINSGKEILATVTGPGTVEVYF